MIMWARGYRSDTIRVLCILERGKLRPGPWHYKPKVTHGEMGQSCCFSKAVAGDAASQYSFPKRNSRQRAACSHIHAFSPPSGAKMNGGLTLDEDCSAVNSETSVISSPLPACKDASVGKETGSQTHTHTLPTDCARVPAPCSTSRPAQPSWDASYPVPLTKKPEEDLEPDAEPALAGIVVGVEDGVDDVEAGHPERHLERRPDLLMGHPHLLLRGPHRRHEPLPHRGWASRAGPRGAGPGTTARGGG